MNEQLMADPNIKSFVDSINNLKQMDEGLLTDETLPIILENIDNNFSKEQVNTAINQIVQNLEIQGVSRTEAKDSVVTL